MYLYMYTGSQRQSYYLYTHIYWFMYIYVCMYACRNVPIETDALSYISVSALTSLYTFQRHTHSWRCSDTREWFLIPSHILIRINRNEERPGSDRSLELIPLWRITKSSFRNLFRNRLRWCPMIPVKRRKTTRTMHTIPRRRILHHFWDTQNVTVSALSWSMPFYHTVRTTKPVFWKRKKNSGTFSGTVYDSTE